jgi:ribonuclease III
MSARDRLAVVSQGSRASIEARLGYQFEDANLLGAALTHGSIGRRSMDYQRLEFLGDRVLGLAVAHALYDQHNADAEGQLAMRLSSLVRGEQCAAVGEALGLEEFIIVGATEKIKGVQRTRSILGDVVEALIGAIYLDAGWDVARDFVLRHWEPLIAQGSTAEKDAKTFLQEWALARSFSLPRYEVVSRTGPDHRPEFTVALSVGKLDRIEGRGANKQSAEMDAARNLLARESLR